MDRTLSRPVFRVGIIACAYLVAAVGARMLVAPSEVLAPVWPAAGILLSALLWLSRSEAIATVIVVFFASAVANSVTGMPLFASIAFSVAYCVGGVVAAVALKLTMSASRRFDELGNLILLVVLGGGLGMGSAALIGAGAAAAMGNLNFAQAWVIWFHSSLLGLLIVVPLGSSWRSFGGLLHKLPNSRLEWLVVATLLCGIAVFGISTRSALGEYGFVSPFLMFPLLVWTALRFGVAGSTVVSFAITFIVLLETLHGKGGFALTNEPLHTRIIEMQLFLASAITAALIPAAALSERHRAADSLAASERRNRTTEEQIRVAAECAALGAFSWDVSTDNIILTSDAFAIYGLPPDHPNPITRQQLERQIHQEDRPRRAAAAAATIYEHKEYEVEYRVVHKDGEIRWVHVKGRAIEGDPLAAKYVAGVVMDVTKRKQTEEALIRTEKLASAGRLAATVAHEINNPLEGVTNILYILERHTASPEQELVQLAQEQLQRVANITKQTLQFYRDAGKPQTFNVGDVIKECVWIYSQKAHAKGVRIETRIQAECLMTGHSGEIRQVVSNLIGNAIDACSAGGKVIVRARPTSARDRRSIKLTVLDSGSGIAPELRVRIFEAFFTTKGERGTGLGLWISAGIISKHNGRISVLSSNSQSRKGTLFSVHLPSALGEISPLKGRRRYESKAV